MSDDEQLPQLEAQHKEPDESGPGVSPTFSVPGDELPDFDNQEPNTILLSDLLRPTLTEGLWPRFSRMFLDAVFLMGVALCLPWILGVEQGGMIALFLVSASMMRHGRKLMDENRANIWEHGWGGWKANRLSALSVLGLFLGMFVTHVVFAALLARLGSQQQLVDFFDFILKTEHLRLDQPLAQRFGSFSGTLLNNVIVGSTMLMLALVYRMYGVLLVLSWNAGLWAVVLFQMFRQAWVHAKIGFFSFFSRALLAVLPHLMLEAFAYILVALAAVFLSRAWTRYRLSDALFLRVARAVGTMIAVAVMLLVVAAWLESVLPGALLSF